MIRAKPISGLAALLLLIACAAKASESYVMTIPGFPGDSTLKGFPGGIEITSFSLGLSAAAAPAHPGGGAVTGKATCDPVLVTKTVDRTSSELLKPVFVGQLLDNIVITGLLSGGGAAEPVSNFVVTLNFAQITSLAIDDGPSGQIEKLTIQPESIQVAFSPLLPNGKLGLPHGLAHRAK